MLDDLSCAGPLVTSIDLHKSRWIEIYDWNDRERLQTNDRYGSACPEEELGEVLRKFTKLERIDLGILPTTDEHGYGTVRSELEERGVKVTWKWCRATRDCQECGKEHD
jgi:hypothetical protein